MTGHERAHLLLDGLGLEPAHAYSISIPGAPYAKSRPRLGRFGAYSKPEDRTAEHRTAVHLRTGIRQPLTGNVALAAIFYRPDRRRIDIDNLVKHLFDAANGVIWHDDSQCTALAAVIEHDPTNPRTIVAVGAHRSSLVRGAKGAA